MAQRCSIQEEQKMEQLKMAAMEHSCKADWYKYTTLCKSDDVTPKNLLTDISYYEHVENIVEDDVIRAIFDATKELYLKAKEMDPQERAQRAAKNNPDLYRYVCDHCNGRRIMGVYGKSCDLGGLKFPSGAQHCGYFPKIPNVCRYKFIDLHLCMDCGFLQGFDKKEFNDAALKAEFFGDLEMEDL